jgi:hypothetical protein
VLFRECFLNYFAPRILDLEQKTQKTQKQPPFSLL